MLTDWQEVNNYLEKTFEFKSFLKTISFVNAIAWIANQHNHHPQIIIDFNKCTIRSTTHDAGNAITLKDYQLTKAIEDLISESK